MMAKLLYIHFPTFIPVCLVLGILLHQFYWVPYIVHRGPYVIEQAPIFAVDPDTCQVNDAGWLMPDTCRPKTVFHPGERFSFQYHVQYAQHCNATFTPWMNCAGGTTLGPENWGGSTTGHPEDYSGKFIARA